MRRRRSAADLLTTGLCVLSVPLAAVLAAWWIAPERVAFEGRRVLGRLGHGPSAEHGAGWLRLAAARADAVQGFEPDERRARRQRARPFDLPGWEPTIDPMTALGELHERGLGVPKDDALAAAWYPAAVRWKGTRNVVSLERSTDSAEHRLQDLLVRRPDLRAAGDPSKLECLIGVLKRLDSGCGRVGAPSRR
jgi:hypothetical protein